MNSMPEPTRNGEQINDTIEVADGHVVHLCCGKLDDEQHRNFCEQCGSEDLLDPPACPIWCNEEHVGEQVVPEIRQCTTDDVYVPDFKGHARSVQAARVFDRITGHMNRPPVIRVEDLEFTARQARLLARELTSLADIIDR